MVTNEKHKRELENVFVKHYAPNPEEPLWLGK